MPLNITQDFPFVARLYTDSQCSQDSFRGSGLFLGPRHILTCAHVIDGPDLDERVIRKPTHAIDVHGTITKIAKCDFVPKAQRVGQVDLAVLTLAPANTSPLGEPAIACPEFEYLYQVSNFTNKIRPELLHAVGGHKLEATLTVEYLGGVIQTDGSAIPSRLQVSGGAEEGFSGCPVLIPSGGKWICVGIATDGGKGKASTLILPGDVVYRYLKENRKTLFAQVKNRFVTFDTMHAAACESVLRSYNAKCRLEWERTKSKRFVEPRLAVRIDQLDRSEFQSPDAQKTKQGHQPLLTEEEKKRPGDQTEVAQYQRLLTLRPKKGGPAARLCVTEDAGSGKSIFTRHLQAVLASDNGQTAIFGSRPGMAVRWEGDEQGWPSNIRESLQAAVAGLCGAGITAEEVVRFAIENQRVCLILDALDQVTADGTANERQKLLNSVFQYLKGAEGQACHVVITGRSYAVTREGDFDKFPADGWVFATLEGFDEGQQRRYLDDFVQGRKLKDFIPNYSQVSELMSTPVILSLITEIAERDGRPRRNVVLDQFQTRGDLYCEAHEKLADRAKQVLGVADDTARNRWEAILAAAAFTMMCDERYRRNYVVSGRHEVSNFRAATEKWLRRFEDGERFRIEAGWAELTKVSQLTNRASVEESSSSMMSWKHRGWMEYFAGLYLALYVPAEGAEHAWQFSNDPDWYWVWRFAIEMDGQTAHSESRTNALAGLFVPPTSGRRPNELIYRAWPVMESTEQGKGVLSEFQSEYRQLLEQGNPVAIQLEASFKPCPPDPSRDELTFMMGSPESDKEARDFEKPQLELTVVPFEMSNSPTTKEQYWIFDCGHEIDSAIAEGLRKYSPEKTCPVNYVTWYDAWSFAAWCGSRLPTEVEWEYACRAGTTSRYWWEDDHLWRGEEMDTAKCTFNAEHTTPSSKDHANGWGLMEMSGNVLEWCDTWFDESLARSSRQEFIGEIRVTRGGSFNDYFSNALRSAYRGGVSPDFRKCYIGFRVSRTRIGF